MSNQNIIYLAFNRGLVSRLALARADLKRLALSAQTMVNWMVRSMGSMMLRPGLKWLGSTKSNNATRFLDFVFSTSQKALLELTVNTLRVWISDALVTRVTTGTTVTGGDFPSGASLAANWADNDEGSAVSSWVAAGQVGFTGTGTSAAIRTATVAPGTANVEHALNIQVTRGPITLRVGSTAGGDEYISETSLDTGYHSLAFTPTGTFYIRFQSRLERIVYLASCQIAAAGVMEITTPWTTTAALQKIRHDQSGDIVFIAAAGQQQYKIERRATNSWSCAVYQSDNGPFRNPNVGPITMTPSVLSGNGTLTASIAFFKTTHVGALFALTSTGQAVTKNMTVVNDSTNAITVTGTGTDRSFTIDLSGLSTTGNTVILQRSFDNATWVAVSGKSWTADTVEAYTDGLENQTVYYRLRCTVFAAGTTVAKLNIATGSVRGICRVTAYTSQLLVSMEVLTAFGGTAAVTDWEEGSWSDYRGWPSATRFYEGRLGWAGKDQIALSQSDDYYGYDPTAEGDAGPIVRTIGAGPVDTINWMLSLQRLLLGGQGAERSCRSNSLDEPLTPTNFNIKTASTQGSGNVPPAIVDKSGIYVQRGGTRVYQLELDPAAYEYTSTHLSAIIPEIGEPSIVRVGVQRQPDTRVHFVRSDGTVAVLLFDKVENIICWFEIESDAATGLIEDVVVLPGDEGSPEDQVYYVVKRTVNGAAVRYLEKWALESACVGGSLNLQADSFITYSGSAITAVTGLGHLEGQSVVVWADGLDVGTVVDSDGNRTQTYTVSGGQITLATAASNIVVGLPYTAQWKSGKLVQIQEAINMQKQISGLGMVLDRTHAFGIQFGPDFTQMDDMPSVDAGAPQDPDAIHDSYDDQTFPFPGKWDTDSRLCLKAMAPRPCTVLSVVCETQVHK